MPTVSGVARLDAEPASVDLRSIDGRGRHRGARAEQLAGLSLCLAGNSVERDHHRGEQQHLLGAVDLCPVHGRSRRRCARSEQLTRLLFLLLWHDLELGDDRGERHDVLCAAHLRSIERRGGHRRPRAEQFTPVLSRDPREPVDRERSRERVHHLFGAFDLRPLDG